MLRSSCVWLYLAYFLFLLAMATRIEANGNYTTPPTDVSCDASQHQVLACVYVCPRQLTCQSLNWPHTTCPPETLVKCRHQCVCGVGYIWNKPGGVCVAEEQCAKCSQQNEYFECDGENGKDCVGKCHCLPHFARDEDGKCA